jgi:hypothetical protein
MAIFNRVFGAPPRLGRMAVLCVWVSNIAFVLGCNQGRELGRVTGHVTLNGKRLNDVVVVFSNIQARAFITAPVDENGAYEVQMAEGFGLPLGTYEVTIRPAPPKSWDRPPAASPIPSKYLNGKTSGLILNVTPQENKFDIELKSGG